MTLREELGQLSWYAKQYRSPARVRRQLRVNLDLTMPVLPRARRQKGAVWGISLVRDELDVLPHTVAHLFAQGVDQVLIADNGSDDGTREFLTNAARRDPRIHVAFDAQPAHWQSEKVTRLAHAAGRAGADWIVPFDADEFWFAPDMPLADWLREQTASIVHAGFHHMAPVATIEGALIDSDFFIDREPSFPGKVAVRAHPLLEIGPGNHRASRVGGVTTGLQIAHAQYRTPEQVARKVRQGAAAARMTGEDTRWFSPHWEKGAQLDDAAIADVWAQLTSGQSDDRLGFEFRDPVRVARPLIWPSWDPSRQLLSRQRGQHS